MTLAIITLYLIIGLVYGLMIIRAERLVFPRDAQSAVIIVWICVAFWLPILVLDVAIRLIARWK